MTGKGRRYSFRKSDGRRSLHNVYAIFKMKRSKKKSSISEHLDSVCNITEPRSAEMSAEMMCQLYEGQLSKYTNVMKGWQFRWFILDPKTGILSYYLNENERKQQPRGWVHLEAAVICPSDEDSNTFSVNSSSGESFKLRAQDAKARQEWVNRLRAVSQLHAASSSQGNPILSRDHLIHPKPGVSSAIQSSGSLALWDAFSAVREHLFRAEQNNFLMSRSIEDLPTSGELKHIDPDLLMLKASSQAMLNSLNQCLFILHQQTQDVMTTTKSKGSTKHESSSHSKKKFMIPPI
ncbi:oxysterol-binding protein-related protein 11 [Cimex lectularius]|uniref:PH domain-containing protein n=1 Tax=Cimex lectularius TaxID=79782 RepID=A0A8I6RZM8_CIMLE|nr:oxysterol-binding protein-related protein 11 [Cimex lectularius]